MTLVSTEATDAAKPPVEQCWCPGCASGAVCHRRYGLDIRHERAVQIPDQRMRVMAQIIGFLAESLDSSYAVICALHGAGELGAAVTWQRGESIDPGELRAGYLGGYGDDDPLASKRFLCTDRAINTVDDVGGRDQFQRTAYARELLAGVGLEATGALYLRQNGRIGAAIRLCRSLDAPQLTPDEVAFAYRVHPLIETAYVCSLEAAPTLTGETLLDRAQLTGRERDVVRLAAVGASNPEIGRALFLSVATVKTHLHHAFGKLGVRSRAELAHRLDLDAPAGLQTPQPIG